MRPETVGRTQALVRVSDAEGRLQLCDPLRSIKGLQTQLPFSAPAGHKLVVHEIQLRDARVFVNMHHRHHAPPVGHLFSLGCFVDGVIVGVAIVGRPVARLLDNGRIVEVTRVATAGLRNVASKLYGAARRQAARRGYDKLITYTLETESGVSLKASGFQCDGKAGGGSWSRSDRQRSDRHPLSTKHRWSIAL